MKLYELSKFKIKKKYKETKQKLYEEELQNDDLTIAWLYKYYIIGIVYIIYIYIYMYIVYILYTIYTRFCDLLDIITSYDDEDK